MGSGKSPKACEKTGKKRQKDRAGCRPVLPKPPRQATFIVRQSMIPKWGYPIFGGDHAQTKISALIRFTRSGSTSGRVSTSDPLFSTD
jgi:hypothetical protein